MRLAPACAEYWHAAPEWRKRQARTATTSPRAAPPWNAGRPRRRSAGTPGPWPPRGSGGWTTARPLHILRMMLTRLVLVLMLVAVFVIAGRTLLALRGAERRRRADRNAADRLRSR